VTKRQLCEELDGLIDEAFAAVANARRIRRSRDITFNEDLRLSHEECARLHSVIKHLLVGHEGEPCPAGERPIVKEAKFWEREDFAIRAKRLKNCRAAASHRESA
jgi:hypothetical protein